MADSVIEESDYYPGKDELDWGYQEGKRFGGFSIHFVSFHSFSHIKQSSEK